MKNSCILIIFFSMNLFADPNYIKNGYDINSDLGIAISGGAFGDDVKYVSKFGANFDIDNSGNEDVWSNGGNYTGFFDTAQSLEVVSSSALDDLVGTGAQKIRVFGLDSNWDLSQEDIEMDGTNAVALSKTYIRIYRAYNTQCGSTDINQGNINIRVAGGGAVCAQILAGYGQTLQAIYTIPNGYTGFVTRAYCDSGRVLNIAIVSELKIHSPNEGVRTLTVRGISNDKIAEFISVPSGGMIPIRIPEKTDIWIHVSTASTNDIDVFAGFDIILVKNTREYR